MKHRALVIGAGRIGAGYNWHDDAYTHAGAYQALSDRVELVGFVEPDLERRVKANWKWHVPSYENLPIALEILNPDIVSVCVQPEQQQEAFSFLEWYPDLKAIWCEKPFVYKPSIKTNTPWVPIQVNYMRRGDSFHRYIKYAKTWGKLIVYGKDDIHTKCHFEDLAKWWDAELDYRVFNGPCAYLYLHGEPGVGLGQSIHWFDKGGVDGGTCFKAMLGNLLDHMDNGTPLWSPAA